MNQESYIEKIMVGKVHLHGKKDADHPMEREWVSAIVKQEVKGKITVYETKLAGDQQADLKNHGGPEKAIFAYPVTHYPYWQKKLKLTKFPIGAFGENLAVQHMTENDVCIGDVYQVGTAIVQVSQPRQPCWKPARRWKVKDLSLQTQQEGLTGWYLRVLQEGEIEAGDRFQLVERPCPEWTIARCNEIMHHDKHNIELAEKLANCNLLSPSWRKSLYKRIEGKEKDSSSRLIGPNE